MNLQQLYYFHKLAEMQHYTKAAKQLYITQPSLSKAIAALEESLGVELFQKEGRNVKLTEQGAIFYKHVDAALAELQKGKDLIDEYNGVLRGSINIGSIPTLLSTSIPEIVYGFVDSMNAHIDVHIFQGFSKPIINGVKSGIYDVGFCHLPDGFSELSKYKIGSQYLKLAVPAGHPFAQLSSISLRQLKNERILSYRTDNYIGIDVEALTKPYHLNIQFDFDDEIILASLVAKKKQLALILDVPDLCDNRNICLIPIEEAAEDFHYIYMIYSSPPKSYIHERLIDFVTGKK